MIRNDFDISDEEFTKVTKPFDTLIHDFVRDNFIYTFAAFYLANGYRMDAIWEGNLSSILYGAMDSLVISDFIEELDYDVLKLILKRQYGIVIKNEEPLEIVDTKKEDQH